MNATRCLRPGFLAFLGFFLLAGGAADAGRLSGSTSPYLATHADDAIDWYRWDEAALGRAREQGKLIFLSIGYASCYWCHVQARTTFPDPRVIELLNANYVSILVDREERPDLDRHFSDAMTALTGRSGYPANFFLTPDGTPLFAWGYMAPEPEYGAPGFRAVAERLATAWQEDRDILLSDAAAFAEELRNRGAAPPLGTGGPEPRALAIRAWQASFDRRYGGFGGGPKFLFPNVLSFLLHRATAKGDRALLAQVTSTLDHMAAGGVRDHLGGAFHRYAVDRYWEVPHFEIMLDVNALMAILYLDAYRATAEPRFASVARSILDDLLARLHLPDGGFAATLDAETEGVEGGYYTWTEAEVQTVLGIRAGPFLEAWLDTEHGLVQTRAVLRFRGDAAALPEARVRFAEDLARMRDARINRPAPTRDDKVLTSWNALAISAFARAAQVTGEARYYRVASAEAARLLADAQTGELVHSRRGGARGAEVFLDDYAFLAQALIDLYETDFDPARLDAARALMAELLRRFQPAPGEPFLFAPAGRAAAIPAGTVLDEEEIPSGNAAALMALERLRLYGAEATFGSEAAAIIDRLTPYLAQSAASATGLLRALDFRAGEAREIVIVGEIGDPATEALLHEVRTRLLPGTVLALIPPGAPEENAEWELLAGRPMVDGLPTAYVCRNRLCDLPVTTPADLAAQLDALTGSAER